MSQKLNISILCFWTNVPGWHNDGVMPVLQKNQSLFCTELFTCKEMSDWPQNSRVPARIYWTAQEYIAIILQ